MAEDASGRDSSVRAPSKPGPFFWVRFTLDNLAGPANIDLHAVYTRRFSNKLGEMWGDEFKTEKRGQDLP
ncbi:MAG: hypothetical protein M1587_08810 [Thaumarchaeota archaeon]|nr:hypothetical protein [Nitrososphaerota archaeon]